MADLLHDGGGIRAVGASVELAREAGGMAAHLYRAVRNRSIFTRFDTQMGGSYGDSTSGRAASGNRRCLDRRDGGALRPSADHPQRERLPGVTALKLITEAW